MKDLLIAITIVSVVAFFTTVAHAGTNCDTEIKKVCGEQQMLMYKGGGAVPYYECLTEQKKEVPRTCRKFVQITIDAGAAVMAGERVRYPGHYEVKQLRRDIKRSKLRLDGAAAARYRH